MCLVLSKAIWDMTDTLPKCIIPQKVQVTRDQMQASNGSLMSTIAQMVQSMLMVTGGWMGHLQDPWRFSSLCRDQLMWLWLSSESSAGQPWAICQARIAARYFLTTETNTSLKCTLVVTLGVSNEGSVATQSEKEWSSLKDVRRQVDSCMVNMSQNRWNLQRPEP